MRDLQLQRKDITLNSLDTEWKGKGSFNKFTNEREVMYVCPECGHHAFALSPKAGWFHCWACGIWGNVNAQANSPKAPSSSPKGERRLRIEEAPTRLSPLGELEGAILSDYIPLPSSALGEIEEISLDDDVSGDQLLVREYLEEEGIALEWAVTMRWGVARRMVKLKGEEMPKLRTCIAYRNYVEGYCCNVKFRTVTQTIRQTVSAKGGVMKEVTRDKGFDQLSSFTPCAPYNIDCLRPKENECGRKTLYITEGEKDCLTLCSLGLKYVISAPSGAQTDFKRSFEAFQDWLKPVSSVVVVGDMDLPGRKMASAIANYFYDRKVYVCRWDQRKLGKDISEVCLRHGSGVANDLIWHARLVEHDDIEDFRGGDSWDKTVEAARGNYDHGYSTGIGPVTDSHFRLFDMGGLIVVTGTPNTGKTDFLNFLTMSLIKERGTHVCFCSFETPDKCRHAGDLTQIWAGGTDLTTLSFDDVMPIACQVTKHITHICMRREKPTPEAVLRKAEKVKTMHPTMEYLVIDPYLYLTMGQGKNITETESIKTMLTDVQDWAHKHHVWVFIVAHPRKLQKDDGSKELEEVDMYTIAGSANWANVADYVMSIKRIQQKTREGKVKADYTRVSVLKVRDQKLCTPGDIYYNRQPSGRYDERATEQEAISGMGKQDLGAWKIGN